MHARIVSIAPLFIPFALFGCGSPEPTGPDSGRDGSVSDARIDSALDATTDTSSLDGHMHTPDANPLDGTFWDARDTGSVRDTGGIRDTGVMTDTGGSRDSGGSVDVPVPPGCPAPPAGVSPQAAEAYSAVNSVRAAMGVPCATMVPEINTAAQRHCDYYSTNRSMSRCVSNPHVEVMDCPGFTGQQFFDRMRAAGYRGIPAFEDMAFLNNPRGAVQMWIDSVWHRTPVLSPWVQEIGYGGAPGCDTMDFGRGMPAPATTVAVYPYPDQTNVPTSFDGRLEGPPPPAPPTGWPSGYPIHIYLQGNVTEHVLTVDGSSTPIDHVWLTPSDSSLLRTEFVMYAHRPLMSRTRYRVRIVGSNGAGSVMREWTFTTR